MTDASINDTRKRTISSEDDRALVSPAISSLPPSKRFRLQTSSSQSSAILVDRSPPPLVQRSSPSQSSVAEPAIPDNATLDVTENGNHIEEELEKTVDENFDCGLPEDLSQRVLEFQKKALWRRFREYKRLFLRANRQVETLSNEIQDKSQELCTAERLLHQIEGEVKLCCKKLVIEQQVNRSSLLDCLQRVFSIAETAEHSLSVQRSSEAELAVRKDLAAQIGQLTVDMGAKCKELERIEELLKERTSGLVATEAKLDKVLLQRATESAQPSHAAPEADKVQPAVVEPTVVKEESVNQSSPAQSSPSKALVELQEEVDGLNASLGTLKASLEETQRSLQRETQLSHSRLNELDRLHGEKAALAQQAAKLEAILEQPLDDDRVLGSALYRELYERHTVYKNEVETIKTELAAKTKLLTQFETSRQQIIDNCDAQLSAQLQRFKSEHEKLETEINRLRGQRDQLQYSVVQMKAKEEQAQSLNQIAELQSLAQIRKEQIEMLLNENSRLKQLMSAGFSFCDFSKLLSEQSQVLRQLFLQSDVGELAEPPLAKGSELLQLLEPYSMLAIKLEHAVSENKRLLAATAPGAGGGILEADELRERVAILEKNAKLWSQILGVPNLSDSPASVLTGEVAEEWNTVQQLAKCRESELKWREQCRILEESTDPLLSEMENIMQLNATLETKLEAKVFNLASKEDQIMRLVGEKTKLNQKIQLLHKQATTAQNSVLAKQRQTDKLEEYLRKLEERERNLSRQHQQAEAEIQQVKSVSLFHEKNARELQRKLSNVEARLVESQASFHAIEERVVDQVKKKEAAEFAQNRLAEEIAKLKNEKFDLEKEKSKLSERLTFLEERALQKANATGALNGLSNSTLLSDDVESLKAQLGDYKRLLKCSACGIRFKSHCILRCMHTFCFECLDDRVRSRQRKCPSCALAFDKADIKQVYL